MTTGFYCSAFTNRKKKPCKYCKHFFLWGISTGHCSKHNKDFSTWEACKYYKRDAYMYAKDGACKHPEEEE